MGWIEEMKSDGKVVGMALALALVFGMELTGLKEGTMLS